MQLTEEKRTNVGQALAKDGNLNRATNINVSIVPQSASPGDFGGPGTPTVHFVGQNVVTPRPALHSGQLATG